MAGSSLPLRGHRPLENDDDGKPGSNDTLRRDRPGRSCGDNVVQHAEEMVIVANRFVANWVSPEWGPGWNLIKHLFEVHVDPAIALDYIFQLVQSGRQLLGWGAINRVDYVADQVVVGQTLLSAPCSWS